MYKSLHSLILISLIINAQCFHGGLMDMSISLICNGTDCYGSSDYFCPSFNYEPLFRSHQLLNYSLISIQSMSGRDFWNGTCNYVNNQYNCTGGMFDSSCWNNGPIINATLDNDLNLVLEYREWTTKQYFDYYKVMYDIPFKVYDDTFTITETQLIITSFGAGTCGGIFNWVTKGDKRWVYYGTTKTEDCLNKGGLFIEKDV